MFLKGLGYGVAIMVIIWIVNSILYGAGIVIAPLFWIALVIVGLLIWIGSQLAALRAKQGQSH